MLLRLLSAWIGLFFASLLLVSCGEDSPQMEQGAGVVSLDDELPTPKVDGADPAEGAAAASKNNPGPTQADVAKPPVTPNPAIATGGEQKSVEPASFADGRLSGAKAINDWHRSLAKKRQADWARFNPQAGAALQEFGAMMGPDSRAYRASLKLEQPQSLGIEFATYARAYGEGDLAALAVALKPTPDPSPAWLAWAEALAVQGVQQEQYLIGGRSLGRVIQGMLSLGYSRDRILELKPTAASLGRQAGDFMAADDYEVLSGESMYVVRSKVRKQGKKHNYRWLADFNRKANYNLREGETLKIPRQELSVKAWRGARIVVVFAGEFPVRIYSCSVGRKGQETPLGSFSLGICEEKPVYYPSGLPAVPYGNPDNPLGERWMGYKESPSYGLHGTNSESTIGSFESEGCIRMHNTDVIELFDLLPVGTLVEING
ncbi:MAG: L,D-transpeptidase [Planctomycetes bacterium]|nr:L,D-transpeptidase [Planctomycetota bacterium]